MVVVPAIMVVVDSWVGVDPRRGVGVRGMVVLTHTTLLGNHLFLCPIRYIWPQVEAMGVDNYFILPEYWDESLVRKDRRVHPEHSHGC